MMPIISTGKTHLSSRSINRHCGALLALFAHPWPCNDPELTKTVTLPNPTPAICRPCAPPCWLQLRRAWRSPRCWQSAGAGHRTLMTAKTLSLAPAGRSRPAVWSPPWGCRRCWPCYYGRRCSSLLPPPGCACVPGSGRVWCAFYLEVKGPMSLFFS